MSRYEDMRYEQARRRRELAEQRVRETTQGFLDRYRAVLADIEAEGLVEYVAGEYAVLLAAVGRMESLQRSDSFAARDMSNDIGARVHALPRMARGLRAAGERAQREAERLEQHRQELARGELESAWQESVLAWDDSLARQLARPELAAIRSRMMGSGNTTSVTDLQNALRTVRERFTKEAVTLREQQSHRAAGEAMQDLLVDCRARVAQASTQAGNKAAELALAVEDAAGMDPDAMAKRLQEVTNRLDEAVVDETCRREVVRAVYQSLGQAGFAVSAPKHEKGDGKDEVVITGRRPAGSIAVFKIELDGRLNYKFENYRGSTCRQDIDRVLPALQSVYGISLSDARVIWENPDDEDRDARPQSEQTREK
jgi:NADH dehydrogenase/NADH:ubiquinone oxidoreductase subunit G